MSATTSSSVTSPAVIEPSTPSSTTMRYFPPATASTALRHALWPASRCSSISTRGSRNDSMVKPRPSAAISTSGRLSLNAVRSPVFQEPLMNWMTRTGMPLPAARRARPMAAVVLPLPLPVNTRVMPRRFFFSSGSMATSSPEQGGQHRGAPGDEEQTHRQRGHAGQPTEAELHPGQGAGAKAPGQPGGRDAHVAEDQPGDEGEQDERRRGGRARGAGGGEEHHLGRRLSARAVQHADREGRARAQVVERPGRPGPPPPRPRPGTPDHGDEQPPAPHEAVVGAVAAELPEDQPTEPHQGGADHRLEDPVDPRR